MGRPAISPSFHFGQCEFCMQKHGSCPTSCGNVPQRFEDLGFLGFWTWDFSTGLVSASPSINHLFSLTDLADEQRSCPVETYELMIHPDDLLWLSQERSYNLGPSGHCAVEYRVIDNTGAIRWIMCRGLYETDHQGTLKRGRGLLIDITRFKVEGNTCRSAPAPFADPLKALVDSGLTAHAAARQIGDAALIAQTEGLLLRAGRLLARELLANTHAPMH